MRMKNLLWNIVENCDENIAGNVILFRALRGLHLPDTNILDKYWDKVMKGIITDHANSLNHTISPKSYLGRVIRNYSNFNNNMEGTYRHYKLEVTLKDILIKELADGISNIIPYSFALYASFIIAYSKPTLTDNDIPLFIVRKIEKMSSQFGIQDTMHLSNGLDIYTYFKNR